MGDISLADARDPFVHTPLAALLVRTIHLNKMR